MTSSDTAPLDVDMSALSDPRRFTLTNPHLLVDLADVDELDPTELGVLLSAQRQLRAYGGGLALAHLSKGVASQLRSTGPGRALLTAQQPSAPTAARPAPAKPTAGLDDPPKLVVYAGGTSGLERALRTDRDLALASGIVMQERSCSHEAAMALLVYTAERTRTALAAVAADIVARGRYAVVDVPSAETQPKMPRAGPGAEPGLNSSSDPGGLTR